MVLTAGGSSQSRPSFARSAVVHTVLLFREGIVQQRLAAYVDRDVG